MKNDCHLRKYHDPLSLSSLSQTHTCVIPTYDIGWISAMFSSASVIHSMANHGSSSINRTDEDS